MRRAFTLIEILVVVAVVALLIAVLLPALGRARTQAKTAVCANNLRQIATGFQEYLVKSRDRMPFASFMPSVSPAPLQGGRAIFLADVLREHVGDAEAFQCVEDQSGTVRPPPNEGKNYFESEASSYSYHDEFFILLGGRRIEEVANLIAQRTERVVSTNTIYLLRDYNNFHKKSGQTRARNYLYADGHVSDFEEF